MALDRHSADIGESANHLFAAAYNCDASTPRPGVYRCRCCGEEITFDSLSADCRCSEECYQDTLGATH
jgi:hypothetical protein